MRSPNLPVVLLLSVLLPEAPAARAGEAASGPLALGPVLEYPELLSDGAPLPAPGLGLVLLSPTCEKGGTGLHILETGTGTVRHDVVAGQVQKLAWLDERRYLVLRTTPKEAALEVMDAQTGHKDPLDAVPLAPPADLARGSAPKRCGESPGSYGLWTGSDDQGQPAAALAVRRSDVQIEVRRYALDLRPGDVQVVRRTQQAAGPAFMPPRHRLLGVVPSLSSQRTVLLWHNEPGRVPALQVDLLQPGPKGMNAARTLTQASDELSGCRFAAGEQVLCQDRSAGDERGWLVVLSTAGGPRVRQLTRGGGAASYALSPDGRQLAYIGSGGTDGPLVVLDLITSSRRQIVLPGAEQGCEAPLSAPIVSFADGDRLVSRGFCVPALHVVSLRGEPEVRPQQMVAAGPEPEPPSRSSPVGQAGPAGQASRAVRRSSRRREASAGFWSPRY